MKRLLMCVVAAEMMTLVADGALSVTWNDDSGLLYTYNGIDVSDSVSDWRYEIICDVNNDTLVGSMITANQWQIGAGAGNNAVDDEVVGSSSYWQSDAVEGFNGGTTDDIPDIATYQSKEFYFRFFNSDSSYVGLVYSTTGGWVLPSGSLSPAAEAYLNRTAGSPNMSGTTDGVNPGGWAASIPVPEPGTWGLMAMGLGMLLVAARKRLV